MSSLEDAKEFDIVSQRGGNVFVTCLPDDSIVVPRDSLIVLLQVVLTAIRVGGDDEMSDAAAKTCMSHLGRRRFQ